MSRLTRDGTTLLLPNSSCETKFSGSNGDREIFIFTVQLTTSRIGNIITRLTILFKKNLNASKPSEHPPQVEECLKV